MSHQMDSPSTVDLPSFPALLSQLASLPSECPLLLQHLLRLHDSPFYSSLFSVNEFLEDLATATIPYLALPYYIAYLYDEGNHTADKDMRLGFLHEAKTYYIKFLVSAEQYEIVKTRKRDKETSDNDDPAAMRLAKVQRFKYIRELEQQISIKTLIEEHADEELQRQRRLLFLNYSQPKRTRWS